MGGGLLVDGKGQFWEDNSWELARRIGYKDPRLAVAAFAVREHGFIHVCPWNGAVRVAVRERGFTLTALAGALLALGRIGPPRILLAVVNDGATIFHLFMDIHDFSSHAEALAGGEPIKIRHRRLVEQRSARVLNYPTFVGARPIADFWRRSRGELADDPSMEAALASGGVQGRVILTRQRPNSDRLITERFGSAINFLRASDIVGRDINEQPDRDYGAWMAQTYGEALWGRRLRIESCRAQIRTAAAATLSVRYDRVLIPWRARGGDAFMMCVSIQRAEPVVLSSSM
jgi:hypothetical protein